MTEKLDLVQRYFKRLEAFAAELPDFEGILHPEMVQREYPNTLNKNGQESDLADMLRRAALGKKILARQSYDIKNHVESGDQVVIECVWRGTMATDAGVLKAGQELKAYFCIVLELKDGLIYRQRNYDCFEPFPPP